MNALVLYVGSQAIAYIHSKGGSPSMSNITHSSHMDIFQNLVADLDTEGWFNIPHLTISPPSTSLVPAKEQNIQHTSIYKTLK